MPPRHAKTIFVTPVLKPWAALKTALLATDKPGVIAFEGAYYGLGYGALNTTHRAMFKNTANSSASLVTSRSSPRPKPYCAETLARLEKLHKNILSARAR